MAKKDIWIIGIIVVVLSAIAYIAYDQYFKEDDTASALLSENTLADSYEEDDLYDDTYTEEETDDYGDMEGEDYDDTEEEDYDDEELTAEDLIDEADVIDPADYEEEELENSSMSEGRYMVMAGQFRKMIWAEEQKALMIKKGYTNTRIELFDKGTWANVLVERFDSSAEAEALVDELTEKGVEATIIVKQ